MAGTPIKQLHLSVRANNVLRNMEIHSVEELIETPIEEISKQRNMGVKTLNEIKCALERVDFTMLRENDENSDESDAETGFTEEQLFEMARHSIDELNLSTRPYHVLQWTKRLTIDKVATLTEDDYTQMKGLGKKSIDEIKDRVTLWMKDNLIMDNNLQQSQADSALIEQLQHVVSLLEPVVHIYWKQLYDHIMAAGLVEQIRNSSSIVALQTILSLPKIQTMTRYFWESISNQGVITPSAVYEYELPFSPTLLIDSALVSHTLVPYRDVLLISRDTLKEACDKICDPEDRTAQILQLRLEGESLQTVGDLFGLTRERVRQIVEKYVRRFPLLYEDYFSEPYQHFHLLKAEFMRAFPTVTSEGYEFLSARYSRGKISLTSDSLAEYNGLWKDRLYEFLNEEEVRDDKRTVSRTEMGMRVLMSNSDKPLSMEEFEQEYYQYIERRGYPVDRLRINLRSVMNHLRNAKGIVFNRDNKARYCGADPRVIWEEIDFTQYQNTVISAELLFHDYEDVMDELDIRDGYELFYVIKASLSFWDARLFPIRCRRVPVMVIGDASEEDQAVKLLKEISPVPYLEYYEAYEERYGVHRESAQGNPVISNAVAPYYIDGKYVIDAPEIDEQDVQPLLTALSRQSIWFVEDVERLFDEVCIHSSRDAMNAAAFRRIGYSLHASYAYDASYGAAYNLMEKIAFSEDVVDLRTLDRRITNLSVFGSLLDRKKKALEYIETAPKVLMSSRKVEEVYGLTLDEIRDIQSMLSVYYDHPFFNGRSIWEEVKDIPIIQKLQGNDWLLTCIMRQQETVGSVPVAGGIILSQDSSSLNVSNICEWLFSLYGRMSIHDLETRFNDMFGTRITATKLAEKLKTSGAWDKVVTDSMDEYIDSLFDADFSDMKTEEVFQEEFF